MLQGGPQKYRELGFPMDFVLGAGDNARGLGARIS